MVQIRESTAILCERGVIGLCAAIGGYRRSRFLFWRDWFYQVQGELWLLGGESALNLETWESLNPGGLQFPFLGLPHFGFTVGFGNEPKSFTEREVVPLTRSVLRLQLVSKFSGLPLRLATDPEAFAKPAFAAVIRVVSTGPISPVLNE